MKYKALIEEREGLREAWKNSPEERLLLEKRGNEIKLLLKEHRGCYQCDELILDVSELFPFCSEDCKQLYWKDKPNYMKPHTIEWAIQRAKELEGGR